MKHIPEGVSPEDISEQLARILASLRFKRNPNPTKFLKYVVESVIHHGLPEPTLNQEDLRTAVFGDVNRTDDSAIVRVTASKLRTKLSEYYRNEGRYDLIVISIPKHSYVPAFELLRVDLGTLLQDFREACPPDDRTRRFMDFVDYRALAIDACFEVEKSHEYRGWSEGDFTCEIEPELLPLPQDLVEINARNQPEPPNNGKYRLRRLLTGSSERNLVIALAPTDYFTTRPVLLRMFDPVLIDENGQRCSPAEKYGKNALEFENCLLPSLVCVHVTVLLSGDKLVLTQRVRGSGTDWEAGKWSPSFEEQMASDSNARKTPDLNFFDTVEAGLDEELGTTCNRGDIKIVSLVMDTGALVVDSIAIVSVSSNIENIQAHWQLKARDGKAELRNVLEVEWSLERMVPVLCGEDLIIGTVAIRPGDWLLTARMRIAACLFHTFGVEKTLRALRGWSQRKARAVPQSGQRKSANSN